GARGNGEQRSETRSAHDLRADVTQRASERDVARSATRQKSCGRQEFHALAPAPRPATLEDRGELPSYPHPVMNPPPVRSVAFCPVVPLALLLPWPGLWLAGCQGKSEPGPPRPPAPVIEARNSNATVARIVAGHPCRADI